MSGAGKFFKCDVADGSTFVYSCKATDKPALRITAAMFSEVDQAARGPRGRGDDVVGGIIAEVEGSAVVVVRLEDWAAMQTRPPEERPIAASKASERRARALRSPMDG